MPTPDDFFSYFANLANNTDPKNKTIIDEARLALSSPSLSHQTFGKSNDEEEEEARVHVVLVVLYLGVLHNYPSSVVVLSLMCNHLTSNSWMNEQVKKIIVQKKDADHYVVSVFDV